MMFNIKKFFNKPISLFPYTKEEVYGFTPNSSQKLGWEIQKFDIEKVWQKSTGENVTVAVIDTGCDFNHPDLKDNVVDGKNFIELNKDPTDKNGHGSHVSGTIAAINNQLGISGIAPKTKIIPVKALNDNGSGDLITLIKSIRWAADQKCDFITMSLGSPEPHKHLEEAINYAADKGCVIFCAAGNSGPSSDILYPAKYDNVIAIGAIDENLYRTDFTCSGKSLDFMAPGKNILGCVPDGKYAIMSGTSMSNPYATACACLLLSFLKKNNNLKYKTAQHYIDVFKNFTIPISNTDLRTREYQGYGIIDIKKFFYI